MKQIILLSTVLISVITFSQVGINTETPKATLDVRSSSEDTSKTDGIIAPKLTGNQLKAKDALYTVDQTGTIVYVTEPANPATPKTINLTSVGYYYFDGVIWQTLNAATEWNTAGTTVDAKNDKSGPIYRTGAIGVSTSNNFTPGSAVHIFRNNDANSNSDNILISAYGPNKDPSLYSITSGGSPEAPTDLLDNSLMFRLAGSTNVPVGGSSQKVYIDFRADGDHTGTSTPTKMEFGTTPTGSVNRQARITIKENGFVGIGTVTPDAPLHIRQQRASNGSTNGSFLIGDPDGSRLIMNSSDISRLDSDNTGGILYLQPTPAAGVSGGSIRAMYVADPSKNDPSQSIGWFIDASSPNKTFGINSSLAPYVETSTLDIAGITGYQQFRMRLPYTPTASNDPNGGVGDLAWDNNYIYIKTASGWKRSALASW